jgi:hypothetical protein
MPLSYIAPRLSLNSASKAASSSPSRSSVPAFDRKSPGLARAVAARAGQSALSFDTAQKREILLNVKIYYRGGQEMAGNNIDEARQSAAPRRLFRAFLLVAVIYGIAALYFFPSCILHSRETYDVVNLS